MLNLLNIINTVLLVSLGIILVARPAHAYLDAGTGSYLLQLLLAGIFAATITLKIFWKRVVGLFQGKKGGGTDNDGDTARRGE